MTDVSRETPPVPEQARGVFSSAALPVMQQYASLLATDGVTRGLIGPREVPRLWERHLMNCVLMESELPHGARVADVGSGAGLPGLVLAIARPDLRVTLIEPLLRRTTFLHEVVESLGLDHVEVVRGRADALHGERTFDVVTSRAVAPLGRLVGWCLPLVAPTGRMLAMKGSSAETEIADTATELAAAGAAPATLVVISAGDRAAQDGDGQGSTAPDSTAPDSTAQDSTAQDSAAQDSRVQLVSVRWADPERVSSLAGSGTSSASPKRRPRTRTAGETRRAKKR